MSLSDLKDAGFDVQTGNHAKAILDKDFPAPLDELCEILSAVRIPDGELIRGGGGEAQSTQRLRKALTERGWAKHRFVIRKIVDDHERSSTTHEIDHVRRAERGTIALEIEWNNKDPFFDRDLENFQRLHAEGVVSVGIIVTRGASLQQQIRQIVKEYVEARTVSDFPDLERLGVRLTTRQHSRLRNQEIRQGGKFVFSEEFSRLFVNDKFGSATTHWDKLQERVKRGVGNPCPLLLIGIPATCIRKEKPA